MNKTFRLPCMLMSKVNRNEEGEHKMQFCRSLRLREKKNPSSTGKVREGAIASIVCSVLDKDNTTMQKQNFLLYYFPVAWHGLG